MKPKSLNYAQIFRPIQSGIPTCQAKQRIFLNADIDDVSLLKDFYYPSFSSVANVRSIES